MNRFTKTLLRAASSLVALATLVGGCSGGVDLDDSSSKDEVIDECPELASDNAYAQDFTAKMEGRSCTAPLECSYSTSCDDCTIACVDGVFAPATCKQTADLCG